MPLEVGGKAQTCSQGEEGLQDGAATSNGLELRPQAREQVGCCGQGDLAAEQHQDWGVREPWPHMQRLTVLYAQDGGRNLVRWRPKTRRDGFEDHRPRLLHLSLLEALFFPLLGPFHHLFRSHRVPLHQIRTRPPLR